MLLALTVALALLVAACESSSAVTSGPTPTKCQLTLGAAPSIVADGGTAAISISAQPECAWTVSTQVNWISEVSPVSGQGNGKVDFRAAPNPAPAARQGDIMINDNPVRVSQEAAQCRFTIDPIEQTIAAAGDGATVTLTTVSGCQWTARSNVPWITITAGASGDGTGPIAFTVAANTSSASRTGTLTIADRTHRVIQPGTAPSPSPPPPPPPPPPTCTYTINPASESIGAAGGAGTPISVSAGTGCSWTAISNAPWITISSAAGGTGNGSVAFTVAANTGAARSGSMTIAGQTFTVSQAGVAVTCTYAINPTSASLPLLGGSNTVAVTAASGCTWTATTSAPWILISTGSSGSGNGSVDFVVLPNIGPARSDTILIAGQTFTVSQAGVLPTCTYTLSTPGATALAAGGPDSFTVSTAAGCTWTATTSSTWISITSGASGNGNGTVAFTVAANATGAARSDTIAVAGQTFTVTQGP